MSALRAAEMYLADLARGVVAPKEKPTAYQHGLITSLSGEVKQLQDALARFREDRERLLARIEFASQPIGACGHCLVGNKPGEHHLPDCPAFRAESLVNPSTSQE